MLIKRRVFVANSVRGSRLSFCRLLLLHKRDFLLDKVLLIILVDFWFILLSGLFLFGHAGKLSFLIAGVNHIRGRCGFLFRDWLHHCGWLLGHRCRWLLLPFIIVVEEMFIVVIVSILVT